MQVFHSSKSIFATILLWAMAILLLLPFAFAIGTADLQTVIFIGLLLSGFSGFCLWILFDTKYKIDENLLYFASGPFRGKIKISSIRRIEYDDKWMKTSLYRPALSKYGLTIYYDKYEDIFISPKDREGFTAALLKINPEIEAVKSGSGPH